MYENHDENVRGSWREKLNFVIPLRNAFHIQNPQDFQSALLKIEEKKLCE